MQFRRPRYHDDVQHISEFTKKNYDNDVPENIMI